MPSVNRMYRRDRCEGPGSRRTTGLLGGLVLVTSVLAVPGLAGAAAGPAHARHHGRAAHPRARRPGRPTAHGPSAPSPPRAPSVLPPTGTPSTAACPNADLTPVRPNLATIVRATICLIDRDRAARGLSALRENPALDRTAAGHSADMVTAGYFDHTGPSGDTAVSRILAGGYMTGCSGCALGENLGVGGTGSSTPTEMVGMWMGDPPHRANILDPTFRDIGVGAVDGMPATVGAGPGATYTADFAFSGP